MLHYQAAITEAVIVTEDVVVKQRKTMSITGLRCPRWKGFHSPITGHCNETEMCVVPKVILTSSCFINNFKTMSINYTVTKLL